jgi:CheY-like chemotaxis protein
MHAAGLKRTQNSRISLCYVLKDCGVIALEVSPDHRLYIARKCYAVGGMNILLVEDSDEVSCITVEYLHELGHQVVAVTEAEEALVRLKTEIFDAVMTDIRLPGMSGLELARSLVKDYPNLPIVISSGYGALNVEFLLGEKQRAVLMLPKPYDLPELERTLHQAAAIRQGT